MKPYLAAACAILFSSVAAAEPAALGAATAAIGPKDCRVVHDAKDTGLNATWTGPCKDGFADGEGKLAVTAAFGKVIATYEGGMRGGRFHGLGYSANRVNHVQYEGYYADGLRDGFGIHVDALGNRYDGNWKAGRRHGAGKEVYALGGSYDGQWQDGKFHGKGTVVYAGGRRAEYEFDKGGWADVAPAQEEKPAGHVLKERVARTGSLINRAEISGSAVPYNLGYAQMSSAQKQVVSSMYPLMDPADEPPYPLNGTGTLLRAVSDYSKRVGASGALMMLVKVGADGKPLSVKAIGEPGPEIIKFATHAVMLDKYKSAMCAGKPCEMLFPYSIKFDLIP